MTEVIWPDPKPVKVFPKGIKFETSEDTKTSPMYQTEVPENILEEANRITEDTAGDRQTDYGDFRKNAEKWAQIASAITNLPLEPEHLPLVMIALKLCREANNHKRDNLVDLAGYARLSEKLHSKS